MAYRCSIYYDNEKKGYQVKDTPATNDYGVDLVCTKKYYQDGIAVVDKIAIQAKRYKGSVGVAAVQQVVGGMHYYGCNKFIFY